MLDIMNILGAAEISGNIGLGLITIGASVGIGIIGAKAAEATGRNPGAANKILTTAIIIAALIEGVALISIFS